MIKWPERARNAIRKLFEPLQDIDVYVEDSNDEVFYRTLLRRVCQDKIRVARVFALGGRNAVVEAAKLHNQSQRRAFFIIDGDLDWVCGDPPQNVIGLHRHDAYCIENLLLCEKALSLILAQEAILTEDDAVRVLDYSGWIRSIQSPLLELFAAFATVHKFAPEQATVSQGVGVMCIKERPRGPTSLNAAKVDRARTKALTAAEAKASKLQVVSTYGRILARLKALPFPLHGVSGKDFLLPLLDFWLQSHGCRIKRKSLRIRMATAGNVNRFAALRGAIVNAARGHF